MAAFSLNECVRETPLLEFVPDDAYLLYATISKAWHRAWLMHGRPRISNGKHFCGSRPLIAAAIAAGGGGRIMADTVAAAGDMDLAVLLAEHAPHAFTIDSLCAAARGGHMPLLVWLTSWCNDLRGSVVAAVAESGNLRLVEWAYEETGYISSLALGALRRGHLHVLQWLSNRGYKFCGWHSDLAAHRGHLHVLQWLHDSGYQLSSNVAAVAAAAGHLHVLQWFLAADHDRDLHVCTRAIDGGHLHVLQWMIDHGYLIGADTCAAAAHSGQLYKLKWLRDRGCQWNSSVYAAAKYSRRLAQWLAANDEPTSRTGREGPCASR